jgi:hypothetical protein
MAMGKNIPSIGLKYHPFVNQKQRDCLSLKAEAFRLPPSPGKRKRKHLCALCVSVVKTLWTINK